MILGLDVSTSITGVTILDTHDTIVYNSAWDTRKFKNIFEKASYVKEQILDLYDEHGLNYIGNNNDIVEHIFIEQSLQSFRSGFSSAKTLSSLSHLLQLLALNEHF